MPCPPPTFPTVLPAYTLAIRHFRCYAWTHIWYKSSTVSFSAAPVMADSTIWTVAPGEGYATSRSTTDVRSSGVRSPAGDRGKWHTYVFAVSCLPSIRSESVIDEICISQRNSGNAHGREVGPMLRHGGSHDWHKRMRGCIAR